MSGRWVWCPDGWQVIPRTWFAETLFRFEECSINQADIDNALAAAPEPPSGWRLVTNHENVEELVLCYPPFEDTIGLKYFVGYPEEGDWWTPLPPPPEVKP